MRGITQGCHSAQSPPFLLELSLFLPAVLSTHPFIFVISIGRDTNGPQRTYIIMVGCLDPHRGLQPFLSLCSSHAYLVQRSQPPSAQRPFKDMLCSRVYGSSLLVVTQVQGFCSFPGSHGWLVQTRTSSQGLLTPDLAIVTQMPLIHRLSSILILRLQNHHWTTKHLFI